VPQPEPVKEVRLAPRRLQCALFTALLGALLAVLAYSSTCLAFVAAHASLLGRVPLAVRNVLIVLISLALIVRVSRSLNAYISRRWLWVPVAILAALTALGIVSSYVLFYRAPSTLLDTEMLAESLRSQKGRRLHLPSDFSGYVFRSHDSEEIVLNDPWVGSLFGMHLLPSEEVLVELTPDLVVKEVRVGNL
jgi:hypothetical protein